MLASKLDQAITYVSEHNTEVVGNKEFIAYVNENLASRIVSEDPRLEELRNLWDGIGKLTYSKEDALIEKLLENKNAKFEELENIISTEIQKSQKLKTDIQNLGEPSYIVQTAFDNQSDTDTYNARLRKHNLELVKSVSALMSPETLDSTQENDIRRM